MRQQPRTRVGVTHFASAAILPDSSVVTWGSPDYGGDSSQVREQLSKSSRSKQLVLILLLSRPTALLRLGAMLTTTVTYEF